MVVGGSGFVYPVEGKYKWGGEQPGAADCSGYVCKVLNENGFRMPRLTAAGLFNGERNSTIPIERAELSDGDLVFFDTASTHGRGGIDHVAFYIGNGRIAHSVRSRGFTVEPLSAYLKRSRATVRGYRRPNPRLSNATQPR